jgi:hypothetical protein
MKSLLKEGFRTRSRHIKKARARLMAQRLRNKGFNARVVVYGKGYEVYAKKRR